MKISRFLALFTHLLGLFESSISLNFGDRINQRKTVETYLPRRYRRDADYIKEQQAYQKKPCFYGVREDTMIKLSNPISTHLGYHNRRRGKTSKVDFLILVSQAFASSP